VDLADLVRALRARRQARRWRWLRSAPLHFVAIGALLFGVRALQASGPTASERPPIEITAERIRELEEEFERRWSAPPSPAQLSAAIEQEIESELLLREARVLGLGLDDASIGRRLVEKMRALAHRPGASPSQLIREAHELGLDDDVVIRRLLVTKMRLLLETDPHEAPPSGEELEAYLVNHPARFAQPALVSFSQVFLNPARRGARLDADARALLGRLRAESLEPGASAALSDPFPLGLEYHAQAQRRIAARFGARFAEQLFALPPGTWSGPIPSPFGLHLVVVHETSAGRLPPLAAVRQQVTEAMRAERAALRRKRGIARLRASYEIRVAGHPDLSSSAEVPRS
jgi:hypothetical protein